jgi:hypothetical protein
MNETEASLVVPSFLPGSRMKLSDLHSLLSPIPKEESHVLSMTDIYPEQKTDDDNDMSYVMNPLHHARQSTKSSRKKQVEFLSQRRESNLMESSERSISSFNPRSQEESAAMERSDAMDISTNLTPKILFNDKRIRSPNNETPLIQKRVDEKNTPAISKIQYPSIPKIKPLGDLAKISMNASPLQRKLIDLKRYAKTDEGRYHFEEYLHNTYIPHFEQYTNAPGKTGKKANEIVNYYKKQG